MDSIASAQSHVEMRGGGDMTCGLGMRPQRDFALAVSRASPVISTRSMVRK